MVLKKVISGGQTGVDRIGLIIARNHRIETGGYAPKGYRTERGEEPEVLKGFKLAETQTTNYMLRTSLNVINSDGTVLFGDMNSSGTKMTIGLLIKNKSPYICNPLPSELIQFIKRITLKH